MLSDSCLVRLSGAAVRQLPALMTGRRLRSLGPRSNYLENGGHGPHSLALIEFQYVPPLP